jgi:dihydroorotase/N-acyl-D-amino-acid deacylase
MRLSSLRHASRSSRGHRVTRLGVLLAVLLGACARPYDVIIENGRVVDGTGNSWMYADVGIKGDRIAAVTPRGALRDEKAKLRIDARGHVVAPGFIDIQNHSWDNVLWKDGRVPSMVTQGVTSVILGESTTPAPSNDKLEALEEIAKMDTARARLQRTFRGEHGFKNWLDAIGRHPNSVNAGSYLGATTVRAYAMGQAPGPANAAQLDTMRVVVRNAMRDGAFGISSALIYPPGSFAGTAELIEMAKAMAPYHGAYITHMRSESDSLFEAMDEAFRIAREGGVQLDIYHLKTAGRRNFGKAAAMVAKIDSARASGLDVGATMYPYPYSGNNLGTCIPDWASENGKLFDNLRDSTTRARILREMADPNGTPLCQIEGPDNYVVADLRKPENLQYEGKKLTEVAAGMHVPWPDAVVALMLSEGRDPSKINFSMSEDNVRMQIVRPWVVIGTDAGGYDPDSTKRMVHPRAYGTYPRILGRYVREERLLTLEDAVRKMSGAVAARLGLRDRGLLREGMYADVVVFDDATILDLSTPAKPHVLSRGVEQVFVNGVQVVRDGRHTGATPGRVLRRG